MRTTKTTFKEKILVQIDPSLDKYDNIVPFPEKHKKMNGIFKKTGHPENYLKSK